MAVYLGTIALEKNRWEKDQTATIDVPAYIERAVSDGFAGVELWAPHYLLADEKVKTQIENTGGVAIFNSYIRFDGGMTEEVRINAQAINRINPKAVKFNLQNKEKRDEQVKTLMEFAEMLNPGIKLLCECHLFTLMDEPKIAASVFEEVGDRFGAMAHTRNGAYAPERDFEHLKNCIKEYGDKICHLHASNYNGEKFVHLYEENVVKKHIDYMLSNGFKGDCTVEFSVGEEAEEMYRNAISDFIWLKSKGIN